MIGKAQWFTRRKYSGWGLTPKSWQGFAYIGVVAGITYLIQQIPVDVQTRMIFTVIWVFLILADILHVMSTIKMDEREFKIEAIAERNASWTMVFSLGLSVVYLAGNQLMVDAQTMMGLLIFPLMAGVIVKAVSNFILNRSEI